MQGWALIRCYLWNYWNKHGWALITVIILIQLCFLIFSIWPIIVSVYRLSQKYLHHKVPCSVVYQILDSIFINKSLSKMSWGELMKAWDVSEIVHTVDNWCVKTEKMWWFICEVILNVTVKWFRLRYPVYAYQLSLFHKFRKNGCIFNHNFVHFLFIIISSTLNKMGLMNTLFLPSPSEHKRFDLVMTWVFFRIFYSYGIIC